VSRLPAARDPREAQAEVVRIESSATRIETPCGDGRLVWHLWGGGSPLMLLHGGSGSWTHWIRNIECLAAAGYQVIVPDLPGSGDSAMPPDGEDADAIPHWLDVGLQRLPIAPQALQVVAFSFGTVVAVLLARDWPQRLSRLILTGPPVLRDNPPPFRGLRAWRESPEGPARPDSSA